MIVYFPVRQYCIADAQSKNADGTITQATALNGDVFEKIK